MILSPATWVGSGSWRVTTDSTGVKFDVTLQVKEEQAGMLIHFSAFPETGSSVTYEIWIVPDETGLYTIAASGNELRLDGIGKLESLPHLATLKSEDDGSHLSITLFELPEVYGIRGFLTQEGHTYTFEIALRSRIQQVQAQENSAEIIQFVPR